MRKKSAAIFFLSVFLLLMALIVKGQTISGKIIDTETNKAVIGANVYLNGTQKGTSSDNDGAFIFYTDETNVPLIVSCIGYETQNINNYAGKSLTILLKHKEKELREVTIGYNAISRDEQIKIFLREFIGTSNKECTISNLGDISFNYNKRKDLLTASADKPLIIFNKKLGYKLTYFLRSFNHKDDGVAFQGNYFFAEDTTGLNPNGIKKILKARDNTYFGSRMHFIRVLWADNVSKEDFLLRDSSNSKIDYRDIVATSGDQKLIKLNKQIFVFYKSETSALELQEKGRAVSIAANGFYDPNILWTGDMGLQRVGELLPFEFQPANKPELTVKTQDVAFAKHRESVITSTDSVALIHNHLVSYLTTHPTEKAYLQLDKPYYAAGDTLWFKAYVTFGEYHELSGLSGVLHADLIGPDNKVSQSLKLQLINGLAWGDVALPYTLINGNYRLRAYSQWMRNNGEESFFEQTIPITSFKPLPDSLNKQILNKPDIQFFPEGGNLTQGIRTKIAFKAINSNGTGIGVKGVVLDSDNNEVASFNSTHLGMGYFYLNPAEGKTYTTKITYENNLQDIVELPKPETKGITLSITDTSKNTAIKIYANETYFKENQHKNYTLFIYSGGVTTTKVFKLENTALKLNIDKNQYPTGIAKITLFSENNNEPLSERLLFIQNNDQLKLNIKSDKTEYAKRETTTINLNVTDKDNKPIEGHFSVSVTDESKVSQNENTINANTILSHLLLTSELKGYIEQPNYYFSNSNKQQTQNDLDLVMLTHGYRKFEWKKVLTDQPTENQYAAEKGLTLTGIAKDIYHNPINGAKISLSYKENGEFYQLDTITNKKGSFTFDNLQYTDGTSVLLKDKSADKTTFTYDVLSPLVVTAIDNPIIYEPANIKTLNEKQQEAYNKTLINGKLLKEVKIKEKSTAFENAIETTQALGNQVIYGKNMVNVGRLSTALQHAVPNIRIERPKFGGGPAVPFLNTVRFKSLTGKLQPMLIIVDGEQWNGYLDDINIDIIETVEVLGINSQSHLFYGGLGQADGGVLVVTTDRNKPGRHSDAYYQTPGTLVITPQGYHKAREFYVPKYDHDAVIQPKEDTRSTIYWQPDLITDKNGNVSFSYPNADDTGNYLVVIEGIDNNGNLGSMRYTYKVQ